MCKSVEEDDSVVDMDTSTSNSLLDILDANFAHEKLVRRFNDRDIQRNTKNEVVIG